jgi:ABC-2 type transport system ATP-binding protein
MGAVLELAHVEKVYRRGLFKKPIEALRGLSLRVRPGEIYGFLGTNGAGKTTTFKILLGLLRPNRGGGQLLGRPLGDRLARRRLGFLPELPAYYGHLTAAEVLRFARDLSGVRRDDRADARLLEELGIGSCLPRSIRRLSKGQLQRVGLAQALVHQPELLVLDEPMGGLDPVARGRIKERLRAERDAGRTVLLSTHVLADVEALADTVGLLSQGRLILEGNPRELLAASVRAVALTGTGPVTAAVLEGMPERSEFQAGEVWAIRLDRPESFQVDACIRRILRAGGQLREIETRREDLEEVFLRTVGEEPRACES